MTSKTDRFVAKTIHTVTVGDGLALYFGYILLKSTAIAMLPYVAKWSKKQQANREQQKIDDHPIHIVK